MPNPRAPRPGLLLILTRAVPQMIEDTQLMVFVNVLGVAIFALIVAYHYVAANNTQGTR